MRITKGCYIVNGIKTMFIKYIYGIKITFHILTNINICQNTTAKICVKVHLTLT